MNWLRPALNWLWPALNLLWPDLNLLWLALNRRRLALIGFWTALCRGGAAFCTACAGLSGFLSIRGVSGSRMIRGGRIDAVMLQKRPERTADRIGGGFYQTVCGGHQFGDPVQIQMDVLPFFIECALKSFFQIVQCIPGQLKLMLHNGIVQIRVRFLNPGGQKRSLGGCLQCIHAFQGGSLGPEGLKVFCLGFNGFIIIIISLFGVQGIVAGVNQFEQFV